MTGLTHKPDHVGLRPQAAAYPMMLVLSFVYPCNAACPHCPYTNSNIRAKYRDVPFMPEDIFRKIADESGPHRAYLRISGGGEPMLHPQATELLVYAKTVGCRIGLITNGSTFTRHSIEALIGAEVDMVEFSVDAMDERTYSIVRPKLKWDTLLANARQMIEVRNRRRSRSKIIASGVNQVGVDIEAVERFWRDTIGVDNFITRKFLTWGTNTSLDAASSADPAPYLDAGSDPCPFLFERLNIDSRGNVMVCGYDIAANTNLGNVQTRSVAEIWHGDGFKAYRDAHLAGRGMDMPLCAECPDWKYRSWNHNYWKVVRNAEATRAERLGAPADGEDDAGG